MLSALGLKFGNGSVVRLFGSFSAFIYQMVTHATLGVVGQFGVFSLLTGGVAHR